jgi:alpha-L-arabinofuranosidase
MVRTFVRQYTKRMGKQTEVTCVPHAEAINSFDAPQAVQPVPIEAIAAAGAVVIQLPAKPVSVIQLR